MVGAPKLPAIHEFIEIPAGSEVEVFMTGGVYRDYPLKDFGILKQIAPVQESLPKIEGAWENAVFRMDEALYAQNAFYPESAFSTGEPGYMRNHRVLSLTAYPILYNPALRTIRCYTEMTFDVVIHSTGPAVTDQRLISPIFERDLENLILNYTKPGGNGKILNNPIGYLVICPTALVPNITPFTDWRTQKGFKVTIADQTDITSWTATGIAAYIANAYNTWAEPPTGVLLVGDTNYITPFTGSASYEVTDLYFSTVTSPDVFPDVYVARMPARNATDVDAMVNKFLDYERNENLGTGWYDQACFLAPPDAGAQGEITHNACIADYFQPAGLTCYTIYSSQGGNTTDIINNLNAGRTACQYSGHGSTTGWAEPAFSISYIDSSLTIAVIISGAVVQGVRDIHHIGPAGARLNGRFVRIHVVAGDGDIAGIRCERIHRDEGRPACIGIGGGMEVGTLLDAYQCIFNRIHARVDGDRHITGPDGNDGREIDRHGFRCVAPHLHERIAHDVIGFHVVEA